MTLVGCRTVQWALRLTNTYARMLRGNAAGRVMDATTCHLRTWLRLIVLACSLGVTHTLDQLFNAPGPVKHFLSTQAHINGIYIIPGWVPPCMQARQPCTHRGVFVSKRSKEVPKRHNGQFC